MILKQLFITIIPMGFLVLAGFIIGKKGNLSLQGMADLLIGVISPCVTFGAIAQIPFDKEFLLLPVISAFCSFFISFTIWIISKRFYSDDTPNLIALASTAGNITYFALPIIIFLVGPEWVGPYLMLRLGIQITEMTWGYYIGSRGNFSIKKSFCKLATFPPLYAMIAGFMWYFLVGDLPATIIKYWNFSLGAIVFCGMMLMGVALSKIHNFKLRPKTLFIFMATRFIFWPCVMIAIIILDKSFFHFFAQQIHIMIALIGCVPLPMNSIAYASKLDLNHEEMAVNVGLSTLFAILYVPFVITLLSHKYLNLINIF